jgi:hypothetical protein
MKKRIAMTQDRVHRIANMILAGMRVEKRFASGPMVGPFYYVYLKPHWKIVAFAHPSGGEESYDHSQLWESVVSMIITKHYGLDKDQSSDIDNLIYCMPRGRVVFQQPKDPKYHTTRGRFVIYTGADMPKSINRIKVRKDIMSKFNLLATSLDQPERVVFADDEHEVMQEDDKRISQGIIGKVPY